MKIKYSLIVILTILTLCSSGIVNAQSSSSSSSWSSGGNSSMSSSSSSSSSLDNTKLYYHCNSKKQCVLGGGGALCRSNYDCYGGGGYGCDFTSDMAMASGGLGFCKKGADGPPCDPNDPMACYYYCNSKNQCVPERYMLGDPNFLLALTTCDPRDPYACQYGCQGDKCVLGGSGFPCNPNLPYLLFDCRSRCNSKNECVRGGTGAPCDSFHPCGYGCRDNRCVQGGEGMPCNPKDPNSCLYGCNSKNICVRGGGGKPCSINADCEYRCEGSKCVQGGTGAPCTPGCSESVACGKTSGANTFPAAIINGLISTNLTNPTIISIIIILLIIIVIAVMVLRKTYKKKGSKKE